MLAALVLVAGRSSAQDVYWVETVFGGARLGRTSLDTSAMQVLPLAPASLPEGLASDDAGNLYWTELQFAGARILRSNPGLTAFDVILEGGSALRGITLHPAQATIYWASSNLAAGPMLHSADLNGGHADTLLTLTWGGNPRGLAADTSYIYWTEFDEGKIRRLPLSGGTVPEDVVTGLSGPCGLAVDRVEGMLY
jgi:hypothetical protein